MPTPIGRDFGRNRSDYWFENRTKPYDFPIMGIPTKDGREPAPPIKGAERAALVRDLAIGEESRQQLAEKYGRSLDAINGFAARNAPEIRLAKAAIAAKPTDEMVAIAIARKQDRIADADQDWEDIKAILEDPNLSPTQRKGYLLLKSKLRREVAEERGELPVRAQLELETGPRLTHEVVGWNPGEFMERAFASPDGRAPTTRNSRQDAAVEPFRVMPPPPPSVEDVEDHPVPEPEPPPVPDYVEQAATTLAIKVWSEHSISRARLFGARPFLGIHPTAAEQYLNHAVYMQWVTVDGDEIARGAVNPQPAPTTRIPN